MGLFDRLFGHHPAPAQDPMLDRALDRTIEMVEPKLGVLPDWRKRLTPGVLAAIDVARAGALQLQQVHDLSAANWSTDPLLRAAFARADSIPAVLARMRELQRWFRAPTAADEAYALLGMGFETRKVLGAALVGDQVRQDVERTQAEFSEHRIPIVAASADELRQAVGLRIFNQLLLEATRELAQADERRRELNVERAMLQARLRMIEQREGALLEDEADRPEAADPLAEQGELRRRLDEMNAAMAQYGGGAQGLDRQLEIVRDTLLAARETFVIEPHTVRLDAMNTVLGEADSGGMPVEFVQVRATRVSRAFAMVRVRRADVPAGGLSIAAVERTL